MPQPPPVPKAATNTINNIKNTTMQTVEASKRYAAQFDPKTFNATRGTGNMQIKPLEFFIKQIQDEEKAKNAPKPAPKAPVAKPAPKPAAPKEPVERDRGRGRDRN
jgi:hypothetical protein